MDDVFGFVKTVHVKEPKRTNETFRNGHKIGILPSNIKEGHRAGS